MDLHPVDEDARQAGGEIEGHADPEMPGADKRERKRFLDQLVEALGAALGYAVADELAQLADDAAGAVGLGNRTADQPSMRSADCDPLANRCRAASR